MSVDLTGAADLHCHFGPDPHRERSVDAFEAANEAAAAGHRAVVLTPVKPHGALLATSRVSAAVHFAVAREFARVGKVLVARATEGLAGPNLTPAQGLELADLGAWIELCAMTCIGGLATRTVA